MSDDPPRILLPPNMVHTKAALDEYDRTEPKRQRMLDRARTNADVYAWQDAENEAVRKVKEAFAKDTADRNSRDRAMLVSISYLRERVAKWWKPETPDETLD